MINIMLSIFSIICCFTVVVLLEKIFKKDGLFIWIAIANIAANIAVCKSVDICSVEFCLGNVLFASNFLAMDILNEKYGEGEAKKGVYYAITSIIAFLVIMQVLILYQPNEIDMVQGSLVGLFSINLRTSIASLVMLYISNFVAVKLYAWLKRKETAKWFRNNITTIICNCLENYLFTFCAFVGIFDIKSILIIATTGSIAEIIIALCDTPFLYWATKK